MVNLGFAAKAQNADIIPIITDELNREFKVLNALTPSAYYMAYRVDESEAWGIQGTFGSITAADKSNSRYLTTMVRVGDPKFDNTHVFKGDQSSLMFSATMLPLDNVKEAVQQEMWKATDKAYKQAKSEFLSKKNKIKYDDENSGGDYSLQEPESYYEVPLNVSFNDEDMEKWKEVVRECSKAFLRDNSIINGDVSFQYSVNRKYFVSSEKTSIVQNLPYARVMVSGVVKSDEGNEMPLYKSFIAESPDQLPTKDELVKETNLLVDKLIEIKNATLAEPYTGPAILSSAASGVFFHEIFGHRVEGHRLKDETDGQTFKTKVGEKVLPKSLNVVFDPTQTYLNDTYLIGNYKFDDQGVPAQKVDVVMDGVLKTFLLSRTPVDGFTHSNGHGRASVGSSAVARQSNMFITTEAPKSDADLRKMLIKECKKQKLEYGYFFKEVTGGFTNTGRYMPNAFNVMPTEVYRVYVDGRPDELVRGVDLIGTPLSMFSEITAAGDKMDVFTGFCGAESGWVPVSAVSPAIFVKKIETQRKAQSFSNGPLLPAPTNPDLTKN